MWKKDSFSWGIVLGVAPTVLLAVLIYFVFYITGIPVAGNKRFFMLAFVPAIILLRYFIKPLHYHKTAKGILIILFVLMILFVVYLIKNYELLGVVGH